MSAALGAAIRAAAVMAGLAFMGLACVEKKAAEEAGKARDEWKRIATIQAKTPAGQAYAVVSAEYACSGFSGHFVPVPMRALLCPLTAELWYTDDLAEASRRLDDKRDAAISAIFEHRGARARALTVNFRAEVKQ